MVHRGAGREGLDRAGRVDERAVPGRARRAAGAGVDGIVEADGRIVRHRAVESGASAKVRNPATYVAATASAIDGSVQ